MNDTRCRNDELCYLCYLQNSQRNRFSCPTIWDGKRFIFLKWFVLSERNVISRSLPIGDVSNFGSLITMMASSLRGRWTLSEITLIFRLMSGRSLRSKTYTFMEVSSDFLFYVCLYRRSRMCLCMTLFDSRCICNVVMKNVARLLPSTEKFGWLVDWSTATIALMIESTQHKKLESGLLYA